MIVVPIKYQVKRMKQNTYNNLLIILKLAWVLKRSCGLPKAQTEPLEDVEDTKDLVIAQVYSQ